MKFWQVDAFTNQIFSGNPAAVFVFEKEPEDALMQNIAREMNLSETAFVILAKEMKIRWFTPNAEVNLCGHATLSAAHVLWQELGFDKQEIVFQSKSGPLRVAKAGRGYTLYFPLQRAKERPEYKEKMIDLLGIAPEFIGSNGEDCMAVVGDAEFVKGFTPDFNKISSLQERGFLLAAHDPSGEYDYLYRGFFPKLDVPEDPVTGSANTCLGPYWAKRLKKNTLTARQVSLRGGCLELEVLPETVAITGEAVTVFSGQMNPLFERKIPSSTQSKSSKA